MGEIPFGEMERYIVTVASCGERIGHVFGSTEGATEKRKDQVFCFSNRILNSVPLASLMGKADFFRLIEDDRKKTQGERYHQSDAPFGKEWNRFEKPDECIPQLPWTGDGGKQKSVTENETQTPKRGGTQNKPILAYWKPWKSRKPRALCKQNLKCKKNEKEDQPCLKITEELSQGQS